jgi:hypothetical protein
LIQRIDIIGYYIDSLYAIYEKNKPDIKKSLSNSDLLLLKIFSTKDNYEAFLYKHYDRITVEKLKKELSFFKNKEIPSYETNNDVFNKFCAAIDKGVNEHERILASKKLKIAPNTSFFS